MSKLAQAKLLVDVVEPAVIDEDLLQAGIVVPVVEGQEVKKRYEVWEYHLVEYLQFSHKGLWKIDNLMGFEGLRKLQLDNNTIERIENLDHLVNLEVLDLSFNNITKIENLDKLTNLTDLSLYNNHIEEVENLDALKKLNLLTLGYNNIRDLSVARYLRRFKHLRILSFYGNPITKENEYQSTMLAHLKNLKYLDYTRVKESAVAQARDHHDISDLEDEERKEELAAKEEQTRLERLEHLREANLLEMETLLQNMLKEDADFEKVKCLRVLEEPLVTYKDKFATQMEEFQAAVLKQFGTKKEEHQLFLEAINAAKLDNEERGMELIREFERQKKRVMDEVEHAPEFTDELAGMLQNLLHENMQLSDALLELEMQLVEQFEDVIKMFRKNMENITHSNIETMSVHLNRLRELENNFHEQLVALASHEYEKFHSNQIEDITEEEKALFMDKDNLLGAIGGSHDFRIGRIEDRFEETIARESKALEKIMGQIETDENGRNRARVAEIWGLQERSDAEIRQYLMDEEFA